jgi:hypothetical protein
MSSEELGIYNYLKSHPLRSINSREICRRAAGLRRYRGNPDWAVPVLVLMREKGIVESEDGGCFRISRQFLDQLEERRRRSRWLAPEIKRIIGIREKVEKFMRVESAEEVELNHLLEA